jgi:hypothetical protein
MRSSIGDERIAFYRTPDKPEFQHTFSHFQRVIAKDDCEPVMNILYDDKTLEPQNYTVHIITPSEGQTGKVFHISFNPVLDDRGKIIGHEGIATDITRITETGSRLAQETLLAEESLRMKSAFMASMTHELRTPLNAIIGFTSVMEALGDSPERSEYVRIVRNSTDMLQRLINDIIEASSITYGDFTIESKETDFAVDFDDICTTLAQRVQNPDVEFLRESPYDHFPTVIDIGRIQQVLTNFVTNAVKFTTKGHIRLGWKPKDNGLYLFCEDTGKEAYPDGYVFVPGTMVPEFESAVLSLEEYQVSDPVKTDYGYHVIMRLPLDPDAVIEYSNDGTPLTARSKAANDAYGKALQDYFDGLTVEYAEGFEAPKLLDYLQ